MNRLQSRAPGGPIVFSGSLNEAGTVTIDGKPAAVDASNNFQGTAQLGAGTTTVTVKAKDASGNETTQQYEVDASGSTSSYTYDANGNLTADDTKTYFWNALNQLVEVKEGTTTLATFDYDGAGRRTEKTASGVTHNYLYDAEDVIEERVSGSSSDTVRYYHGAGIDEPLARKNSSDVVTYYLADHLGSIVQETSSSGVVDLSREYDPWGNLLQGGSVPGYAFTGREWDTQSELYFFRARLFSPTLGRFLSQDPLGLVAGPNQFAYVGNSPTALTDPFGLCSGEQDQENQLDKKYRELAGRRQRTILDEATPEIARRARPMGEPDTYTQLTAIMLLSLYVPPGSRESMIELMNEVAVAHPAAFEAISDLVLSFAPTVPAGLVQHGSVGMQQTSWFSKVADVVMTFIAK